MVIFIQNKYNIPLHLNYTSYGQDSIIPRAMSINSLSKLFWCVIFI